MQDSLIQLFQAVKTVLRERRNQAWFLGASAGFFSLFVLLPVFTTPGNDLKFQLSIFTALDYVLLTVFSVLAGLLVTMQMHIARMRKQAQELARAAGGSALGGASGVAAAIFGTAACTSCVAGILGIFGIGIGTTTALLTYRWYIVLGALVLMILGLRAATKKVNGLCESC